MVALNDSFAQSVQATVTTSAFLSMAQSGQASKTTSMNLVISGPANMTQYQYALGPDATLNCSLTSSYSAWGAKIVQIKMDLSSFPDGMMKLCVRGRLSTGAEQPLSSPTIYRWKKDTLPPGAFSILSPAGSTVNTLTPTITLGISSGADGYNLKIATTSSCASGVVNYQQLVGINTFNANLPSAGTYYICAEAFDESGFKTTASNNGASFVASPSQEVVVKDHVTDQSCWNVNTAFHNFNGPGEEDSIAAAAFTGGGGKVKRVGAIFSDSDCSTFNNGRLENMTASVAFYESPAVFMSDPFLKNQPPGSASKRVSVPIMHLNPSDPQYFMNPVRVTPTGTQQFYVEVDAGAFNLQTVNGQQHLVALWLSSESSEDGSAWTAFSKGCPGQVGSLSDYYRSDNNHSLKGPGTFASTGASQSYGAFFVTELR